MSINTKNYLPIAVIRLIGGENEDGINKLTLLRASIVISSLKNWFKSQPLVILFLTKKNACKSL